MSETITVEAAPSPFRFEPAHTALVLIDMQRDFVEPGGFGETLATTCRPCKPWSPLFRSSWPTPGRGT